MVIKQRFFWQFILTFLAIGGFLSWSIGSKIGEYQKVKSEIEQLRSERQRLAQQVRLLREKKKWYQSEEFIRRQAREKLGLGAANEVVYLFPTPTSSPSFSGEKQRDFFSWLTWLRRWLRLE